MKYFMISIYICRDEGDMMRIIVICFVIFCVYKIYEMLYYNSGKFNILKQRIVKYVSDCNELNIHIQELKKVHIGTNQLDYGNSNYSDYSKWNYKRPKLKESVHSYNVYNCSRTVCDNSRKQPFKYICKYFNIEKNEETLSEVETVLNNFSAVEDGYKSLINERDKIISSIKGDIPLLIKTFSSKKLPQKLGFYDIDLKTPYFPKYVFSYVSSGGNASLQNEVILDIPNLNKFVTYLSEVVKFKKSARAQRALMTSQLRRKIMERDNFSCQICGLSNREEPNLLLEIDHIIPIAKGGMTTEDNLQTLCWRCNRSKGSKIIPFNNKDIIENEKDSEEKVSVVSNNILNKDNNVGIEEHREKNIKEIHEKITNHDLVANEEADTNDKNKEERAMYDVEKGIYPAGHYLVGDDIPLGKYLLTVDQEGVAGSIEIYNSYSSFKKDESTSFNTFKEDFFISFREEKFIVVLNAKIQRV